MTIEKMTKHSCKWHLVAYSYKLNGCKYLLVESYIS
jgi:hypothetical protein